MATDYGKILRIIRVEKGELLGDMADSLGVSSAYLSSIENGNRNVPAHFTDDVVAFYHLTKGMERKLRKAEISNMKEVKLSFEQGVPSVRKETAYLFARTFKNMEESDIEKIRDILLKREGNK